MHKPENKTHKILWDFDMQTDPSFLARRTNLVLINFVLINQKKRICELVESVILTKVGKNTKTCYRNEKVMKHEGAGANNRSLFLWNILHEFWKKTWWIGERTDR